MKRVQLCLLGVPLAMLCAGIAADAQTLSITNGLSLWLKADSLALSQGNAVNTWLDSGNTNHMYAFGSAPTFYTNGINGKPAVRFDGDDGMIINGWAHLPSGYTYFAVYSTTNGASGVGTFGITPVLPIIGDISGNVRNSMGVNGGFAQFNSYSGASATGTNVVNDGRAHIMSATHSLSGTMNLYFNGFLEATDTLAYNTTYNGFDAIAAGYGIDSRFEGEIAEILIYSGVLSDTDREHVEAYLDGKYSLGIPEPSAVALLALGGLFFRRRLLQHG